MARTRSQDYDAIKITILDKAADLFADKGFTETSIIEISEASGLSKSGIYHYFKSKHEVLNTMLLEHVEMVLDVVNTALKSSADPLRQFETLTRNLLETYSLSKSRHTVMMNDLKCLKDRERTRIIELERKLVALTEGLIKRLSLEKQFGKKSLRPVVMLYFGMLNWTYTWYDAQKGVNPKSLAEIATTIFLNGLLPPSPPTRRRTKTS